MFLADEHACLPANERSESDATVDLFKRAYLLICMNRIDTRSSAEERSARQQVAVFVKRTC